MPADDLRIDSEWFDRFLAERDRRLDERFSAQEQRRIDAYDELQRRLDTLNHAHEQAREKERDFIQREVYEKSTEQVANVLVDQDKRNNVRFGNIETSIARLQTGGFLLAVGIVANLVKLWFS